MLNLLNLNIMWTFFFFFSLTILSSSGRKIYEKNLVSWSLFHSDILIRKKSFSRVRAMDYCRLLYYIILPPYSQVLWSIREKDFRLQMYCMHNKLGTISFLIVILYVFEKMFIRMSQARTLVIVWLDDTYFVSQESVKVRLIFDGSVLPRRKKQF